jgi:hypothetical protein
MDSKEYFAAGTAQSGDSIQDLAATLGEAGLTASLRESSHFLGGVYVSIRSGEARMTAEKINPETYHLLGDGDGPEDLTSLCGQVSRALASKRIAHSIELYDHEDQLQHEYEFVQQI